MSWTIAKGIVEADMVKAALAIGLVGVSLVLFFAFTLFCDLAERSRRRGDK